MILVKTMHGKSQWAYADKTIEPYLDKPLSAALINLRRESAEVHKCKPIETDPTDGRTREE